MSYKHSLTYKLISILLITLHLFVFCLRDAGVVFAETVGLSSEAKGESALAKEDSVDSAAQSSEAAETSGEGNSQNDPESKLRKEDPGPPGRDGSQSQSNSSNFNLNALQSLQPSLFTGALIYSVPIAVPPGRKGIQPNIALTYSSQSGNGILGMGWSLDLGSIERSTKRGVPTYDNDEDTFIFKSGGSTVELVNIGGNDYRAKIEGASMKFTFDGYSWTIKDKSGITYYFGQAQSSQQVNDSNIYKWCLDKVQDTLGNYMTLTYIKDNNQIYPDTINYTGYEPSINPAFQVQFNYLDSRDDYFFSYRSNFLIRTNKLLNVITVKQNGQRIRKYSISYEQSPSTKRYLLKSVTQYGLDDSSSLPPIEFNYQEKPFSFSQVTSWNNIHDFGNNNWVGIRSTSGPHTYADIFDINRDGLPDRIFRGYNSSDYTSLWVQLNNGISFDDLEAWSDIAAQPGQTNRASIRYAYAHCYMNTFDINGDAFPDRIHTNDNNYTEWEVEINNGNGFNSSITWGNIGGNNWHPSYTRIWGFDYAPPVWGTKDLFDINGDGKPDRVIKYTPSDHWYVQLNNGDNSFDNFIEWSNVQYDSHISESYIRCGSHAFYFATFDINGDGLPDHLMDNTNSDDTWKVQFNNGNSFEDKQDWGPLENANGPWSYMGYGDPVKVITIDINGDGLPDRVMRNYDDWHNNWQVQINNGHGFEPIVEWGSIIHNNNSNRAHIRAGSEPVYVDFFDINGDGLPDRVMRPPNTPYDHWDVQLNNGPIPDLLLDISNGVGGGAAVTYDSYIGHDNTEEADKGNLGFPVNVVTQIQTLDGRGSTYSSTYSYDKGKFDYQEREFRGFGKVTVTDIEGNYSISYFHQDDYKKGRSFKQETFDSAGNLYAKTEYVWNAQENIYSGYSDIKFVYLSESNNYTYNGDSSVKRTKAENIYAESPQYGNPTQIIEYGQVDMDTGSDMGDDKRTTFIEYTYNTVDWIVSLPSHIQVEDINSDKVSEKKFYYDNNLTIIAEPSQGLLTKEEVWCFNSLTSSNDWLSAQYAYDNYGNLTSSTDANNNTTTTTYDSTYYIYPLTASNALGHSVTSEYYGVNGVPLDDGGGFKGLFGQVKSTQDPNQVTTYNIYDDLGRIEKAVGPSDTINYPGAAYEYDLDVTNPLTDPVKITKKIKAKDNPASFAYPDYYASYSFYDGLGRFIEAKSPAEPSPDTGALRQIISGVVEYNSRGLVDKKYLPYFVGSSPDFVSPNYSQPYSNFQYDCLGRVTQATNPDSTYSSMSYDDWIVTATDENGHYKTYYYDAYQRLIQVDEHNQGSTYTTTYEYDILGSLTMLTDHLVNTTNIIYDSLGRKIQMDDPDMGTWSYEYDNTGNLTKQIDAAGQELEFSYDAINRLIQKTIQATQTVTYEYDDSAKDYCIGRLSKVIYEAGQTEFFYDNLGREIESVKTVDAIDYTVERTYDVLDRLVNLIYPDAEVVTYTYNPQGIEAVIGSATYISNIDYSATSQITKIEYGNGTATEYSYDPQTLRLAHLTTSDQQLSTIQDLQYSFDSIGNILGITDNVNTGTQTFAYDDLNRLTYANGASYGVVDYSYDSIGNILTKGNLILDYNSPRPHAVSSYTDSSTGHTVNFTYDDNGNLSNRTNQQTNEQTNYYYDFESHLTKVEQVYPEGSIIEATLQFEEGWNFFCLPVIPDNPLISDIFQGFEVGTDYDQISSYDPNAGEFEHYVGDPLFDEFNTLEYGKGYVIYVNNPQGIDVTVTGTTPEPQDISLSAGWNLIPYPYLSKRSTQQALGNLVFGVDYDLVLSYNSDTGEFEEYPGSLTELQPNKSYYLHCLQDTTWQLEPLSRTTDFYYDGDGGRVKRVSEIDEGQTTFYIGSLYEKITYDNPQIPTKLKKHVFAGANRVCTNELTNQQTNQLYYHGDHLGSSNVITDETGNQVALYEYRPFGEVSFQSGTYTTDIKYTGKIQDDTGLYYYGARYYDPVIGRFISPDSIVQAPQDPQALNRYAYCRNNPVKYVDPTGYGFLDFLGKVLGIIAAVVTFIATGGNAAAAFAAFNITDTVVSGGQALGNGADPSRVLGAIGMSITLNILVPGGDFAASNTLVHVGFHATRGAAISSATTAAVGGDVGEAAAWGGGMGAVGGFLTTEQFMNMQYGDGFKSDATIQKEWRLQQKWEAMLTNKNITTLPETHSTFEIWGRELAFGDSKIGSSLGALIGKRHYYGKLNLGYITELHTYKFKGVTRIKSLSGNIFEVSKATLDAYGSSSVLISKTFVHGSLLQRAERIWNYRHYGNRYSVGPFDCRGRANYLRRRSKAY